MLPRTKKWLIGSAALAAVLALPVVAQDRPESLLPPDFNQPAPTPQAQTNEVQPRVQPPSQQPQSQQPSESGAVEIVDLVEALEEMTQREPVPQVEYPAGARRDPRLAGTLDPVASGFGYRPWGAASGKSLQILMRRMDTPLASRWSHIGLRNLLLAKAPGPLDVHPADWAAERSWLLLRMGEADAGRLLVASVDTDQFTPKMRQMALQSALANSDPAAMCPIEPGLSKVEPRVAPLVTAICASLAGESERAAADIEAARRRGRLSAIDVALADKVVGAAAETSRAVTIEWDPVEDLNSWRFGLATATGMMPPERLINSASIQTQAWLARSPMFSATQKLPMARTAAALGVLSGQSLLDLYTAAFDATDPDALGGTDAWQLRLAYVGADLDARLSAMRTIWGNSQSPRDRLATQVLLSRAARRVPANADLQSDAPDIVASLFAGGFDREAARWSGAVGDMDDEPADAVWGMLAVGAPDGRTPGIDVSRIEEFADRDESENSLRTAILVAGLAGLGRIDGDAAGQLNRKYKLGLGGKTGWTEMIDGAMRRRQTGSVILLTASALQGTDISNIRGVYLYHAVTALRRTGQEYLARMILAEALART
ncbi:hypothetical protein LZ496_12745 [Sphingomonas sp. NSE70-1]|uniref:Antifreeze glycopeptide polyprotein n=1 Tax=Sphingomonas caseinilyticus TaxID=2908205 RepID=A0ABT0RXU6_9SPHN|nr:hypothetical protein [Sphingomonas caseinilyticus]MCL6699646.1 hypothetical protein [Sphingomonas caseinilyticus]